MNDGVPLATGGCLCGGLRYEIDDPPEEGGLCHCRVCQRTSGSAFEALICTTQSQFRYVSGDPKRYRSCSIMEKCFCPTCGSHITDQYLVTVSEFYSTDKLFVHIGTLDEPQKISITLHTGVESQLPWLHFNDDAPRIRCDEDTELAAAYAAGEAART